MSKISNHLTLTDAFAPTLDWLNNEIRLTQKRLDDLHVAHNLLVSESLNERITTYELPQTIKATAEDFLAPAPIGHNSDGNGTQKPTLADTTPHAYEALAKSILDDRPALRQEILALLGETTPLRAGDFISIFKVGRRKRHRQVIYNALSQMKKAGDLVHENGTYRLF